MGCGKSTVGRLLAKRQGLRFIDMDHYIEQQAGMSVSAIFERFGEADFRSRERDACAVLAAQCDLVIAAGGGALVDPDNAKALSATGTIVLLEVTPETVLERLKEDTTRPLLMRPDREQAVQELLAARLPLYRQAASFSVDGGGRPEEVVRELTEHLQRREWI